MFHSRNLDDHINQIHERILGIVYEDYQSTFREFLFKDNSSTIY